VSDTGKGISPDFLPYVFERFRQADSSSTRKYGGLGLGLAIVRHLTELNGGSVQASSRGVDQGATFTVRLPLAIIHEKNDPVRYSQPVFPHAAQQNTGAIHP
jgi:signal transduction histidine kinase